MPARWFVVRHYTEGPLKGQTQVEKAKHYKKECQVLLFDKATTLGHRGAATRQASTDEVNVTFPNGIAYDLRVESAEQILGKPLYVISSMIKRIGMDGDELVVQFTNNSVYRYEKVPVDVFFNVITADSIGQMFNRLVKNQYFCRRIE